jgi:hypothetical protein
MTRRTGVGHWFPGGIERVHAAISQPNQVAASRTINTSSANNCLAAASCAWSQPTSPPAGRATSTRTTWRTTMARALGVVSSGIGHGASGSGSCQGQCSGSGRCGGIAGGNGSRGWGSGSVSGCGISPARRRRCVRTSGPGSLAARSCVQFGPHDSWLPGALGVVSAVRSGLLCILSTAGGGSAGVT